jgi:hypothetical protein
VHDPSRHKKHARPSLIQISKFTAFKNFAPRGSSPVSIFFSFFRPLTNHHHENDFVDGNGQQQQQQQDFVSR